MYAYAHVTRAGCIAISQHKGNK